MITTFGVGNNYNKYNPYSFGQEEQNPNVGASVGPGANQLYSGGANTQASQGQLINQLLSAMKGPQTDWTTPTYFDRLTKQLDITSRYGGGNIQQAGPITHAIRDPNYGGATHPIQITGDYAPWVKQMYFDEDARSQEYQKKLMEMLTGIMGQMQNPHADGTGKFLESALADVENQRQRATTSLQERFAGLGRSATSSALLDALGVMNNDAERARLKAYGMDEELAIQRAQLMQQVIPSIMSTLVQLQSIPGAASRMYGNGR